MLKIPIAILILFVIAVFFFKKNHKAMVILLIISEINNLFALNIAGVRLSVWAIIIIINIPWIFINHTKLLKERTFSNLFYEYYYLIALAIVFSLIFPWDGSIQRAWNQGPIGRSIVSLIRLFSELMSLFYIYVLIVTQRIKWGFLRNRIAIVVILSVLIAIADYFTKNQLRQLFFVTRDVPGRFLGFCGEPRYFGRTCLYAFVFFICVYNTIKKNTFSRKLILFAGGFACLGTFLSMSVSANALLLLSINVYTLLNLKKYFLLLTFVVMALYFTNINIFIKFDKKVLNRIDKISEGVEDDRNENEPLLFTRLEVFDRAAMNFLYNNTIYALVGTGPNLISIPASNYLSRKDKAIYGNQINSVPHTGVINIFARSGLIGLFLITLFIYRILKKSQRIRFSFQTTIIYIIVFLIIYDSIYFVLIGMSIGYLKLQMSKTIINNCIYGGNQTSIVAVRPGEFRGVVKC